jgi:hypothetical protein
MRVGYQDCGCVSVPEQVVREIGLKPGTMLDVEWDSSKSSVLFRISDQQTAGDQTASCRTGSLNS